MVGTLRTRPRYWLLVVFLASLMALIIVVLILKPRGNITQANFQKIRIGMTESALRHWLGPPDYQTVELGLVRGPISYSVDFGSDKEALRQQGHRDYRRQQWSSAELTIIAISDTEGKVVCCYRGEGQKNSPTWRVIWYWISQLF
jgi:hypothetical protein